MADTTFKKITFNPAPQTEKIEFIKWKDQEIPKTIYKYRSWDNKYHQRLINRREVYFPTAQELNDPFDCQRNFDWEMLKNPDAHREYVMIAAERCTRIYNYSSKEKEDFIARGLQLQNLLALKLIL